MHSRAYTTKSLQKEKTTLFGHFEVTEEKKFAIWQKKHVMSLVHCRAPETQVSITRKRTTNSDTERFFQAKLEAYLEHNRQCDPKYIKTEM